MHTPTGYTHVVEVTAGRPIYIAGQVALNPAGVLVGPGDVRAQTRQVFDNLQAALSKPSEPASTRWNVLAAHCEDEVGSRYSAASSIGCSGR
jgi:enamine deaminase RidA (YjgF/YER057c/UK114 family)